MKLAILLCLTLVLAGCSAQKTTGIPQAALEHIETNFIGNLSRANDDAIKEGHRQEAIFSNNVMSVNLHLNRNATPEVFDNASNILATTMQLETDRAVLMNKIATLYIQLRKSEATNIMLEEKLAYFHTNQQRPIPDFTNEVSFDVLNLGDYLNRIRGNEILVAGLREMQRIVDGMAENPARASSPTEAADLHAREQVHSAEQAAKTLHYDQETADKGDSYSQRRMGERYRDGEGVEKNLARARSYLQRAAAQNDPQAIKDLSEMDATAGH